MLKSLYANTRITVFEIGVFGWKTVLILFKYVLDDTGIEWYNWKCKTLS